MKVTGGCHCGAIRYEAEVDPSTTGVCHCTDCQKFSGSAFRSGVNAAAKDFRLLAGVPRMYVKTAESGAKRAQAFCAECGTHIYATSTDPSPTLLRIRTATTDQAAALVPKMQIWTRSALPWVAGLNALPGRAMQ
ncbi:MAG TPA: GFA family protein [Candidatus Binatia bacterium]|jgi:hypothetical protein